MATVKGTAKGHWDSGYNLAACGCPNYRVHMLKEQEDLVALGDIIQLPFADSTAVYQVVSIKPPVLKHVPMGDAWQALPATIRGLRAVDLQQMIDSDKAMRELFKNKN